MFEKASAQPLFPSTLWVFDLKAEAAGPMNQHLIGEIDRLISPKAPLPPGGTWQTDQRLHELEAFQEMVGVFRQASKEVLDQLAVEYNDFVITGCWANVNPKGSAHRSHNHPNNYLSGVYYLQVPPGSGVINFYDPRPQATLISPKLKRSNLHNSIVAKVRVKPGQAILFPSWLVHAVPTNPSDEPRISVSFNIMFPDFVERVAYPKWEGIPLSEEEDTKS